MDLRQTDLHRAVLATIREIGDLNYEELTPEEKRVRKEAIFSRFRETLPGLLARAGANINARDSEQQTPLMYALPHPELMESLLEAGANPNLQDRYQHTALHLLASQRISDIEPYLVLIVHGADITKTRASQYFTEKRTPLDEYLFTTRPVEEGGQPRGRNPDIVELLTTPIPTEMRVIALRFYRELPEEHKNDFFSRIRAHLRRRHALAAYASARPHRFGPIRREGGSRRSRRRRSRRQRSRRM